MRFVDLGGNDDDSNESEEVGERVDFIQLKGPKQRFALFYNKLMLIRDDTIYGSGFQQINPAGKIKNAIASFKQAKER